jgi:hypothetical protein
MATARLVDPRVAETINVVGPTIAYITPPVGGDRDPCVMRGAIPPGGYWNTTPEENAAVGLRLT